ncbi:MAG: CoA transferase [Burkholderiales bacterium]|nr:CoA transferase [Burkholderiales bacterium]
MSAQRPKPLAGLRVLDLTRLLPGPLATMHLADLGADVVKIEDTGPGDYTRVLGHRRRKPDGTRADTDFFLLINRNKRALRLDLKQAAGREVFVRLAKDADVVVEGFRPGVMAKLGVGYDVLAAANPKLVYCAISGYGQDGPLAGMAGHDINYVGYAGVGDQMGREGAPPTVPNFQIGDLLGGTMAAVMGVLAAVIDARATGRGRFVDVSMTDAVLAHAIVPLVETLAAGRAPPRGTTMLAGGLACYNVYETADGRWMAVGALEEKFWHTLCDTLGAPELKPLHLVFGEAARPAKEKLAAIFASQPQAHWTAVFAGADCCVTPILTMEEALAHPLFAARGMVVRTPHPAGGELPQLGPPVKFSEFAFAVERGAPRPGEHSEEVLAAAGYTGAEIARLREEGVI